MTDRVCSVGECDRKVYGLGFCRAHYDRFKKHGEQMSTAPIRDFVYGGKPCSVHGCTRPAHALGLCQSHDYRLKKFGAATATPVLRSVEFSRKQHGVECLVPGCDGRMKAKGLCNTHYYRLLNHGDPLRVSRHQHACVVCDAPTGDPGGTQAEAARHLGVSQSSIRRHRLARHEESEQWHAKRAAYWVNRLAEVQAAGD